MLSKFQSPHNFSQTYKVCTTSAKIVASCRRKHDRGQQHTGFRAVSLGIFQGGSTCHEAPLSPAPLDSQPGSCYSKDCGCATGSPPRLQGRYCGLVCQVKTTPRDAQIFQSSLIYGQMLGSHRICRDQPREFHAMDSNPGGLCFRLATQYTNCRN